MSMTRTDIATWLLASSPNGRALALPVRHLDRGVIPSEPRTLELRPETRYLDAEWILHLCGLHRSQHRRVPALGGVALRLDEPHHRGVPRSRTHYEVVRAFEPRAPPAR